MDNPQFFHTCLDFSKYLSHDQPGKLSLWGCLSQIGFIRGLSERLFLTELKKFLTSQQGNTITYFNFEKNFHSLAVNADRDFDLFIDMLAENNSIKILEIGNNYIPNNLAEKLVNILSNKSTLAELNVRMHWPGFKQSNQNLPFITHLIKQLPYFAGLEKLDLSGNHLNEECLIALADFCESSEFLLEVNLTDVTYVAMTPHQVSHYWLRINNALRRNQDLLEAIKNMPDDTLPQEKPKPIKRKLIANSDDEQEISAKKAVKNNNPSFFKQSHQVEPAKNSTITKSFTERLTAIGFDIETDTGLGEKSIELIYYVLIGKNVFRKFMEDPHALFYFHQDNTYQRNYDGNYIKEWVKTNKWDPYSQISFKDYLIVPNLLKKREINILIEGLEREHCARRMFQHRPSYHY